MRNTSDFETMRRVRSHVVRRYIDCSRLEVRVLGGVVHIVGVVGRLRSHRDVDLSSEIETINHILRQQPGVRDVVWETTIDDR